MSGKHWALLGACLVSLATLGAGLSSWAEATKPSFVFGAVGALGSTLAAIYTPRPQPPK